MKKAKNNILGEEVKTNNYTDDIQKGTNTLFSIPAGIIGQFQQKAIQRKCTSCEQEQEQALQKEVWLERVFRQHCSLSRIKPTSNADSYTSLVLDLR